MKKILMACALLLIVMMSITSCRNKDQTPDISPEHTHSFEEWEVIKKPTCFDEGFKVRYCSCGERQTEIVVASDHLDDIIINAVQPTCTESGLTMGKKCSACKTVTVEQEIIPATGHTEVTLQAVAPTCTSTGLTEGKKCSVCDTVTKEQTTVAKLVHTEVDVPGTVATCTTAGLTDGKQCSVCQIWTVPQETIPAKGHTEQILPGTPATCITIGLTDGKKCSVCQTWTVTQTVVPIGGHTEVTLPAVAPTCTSTGLTEGKKCSVCNTVTKEQTTVAKLAHTEVDVPGTVATCTTTGLTDGKQCSVCQIWTVTQTVVLISGHTEVTLPAVAPTCTSTGLTEGKKCSVCNTVTKEQTTVAKLAHTEVTLPAVAPTCTSTGLTEGKKCSVCQTVTVGQETIPVAHIEVTLEVVDPTCTEPGFTEGKKCSACDIVLVAQTKIYPLGHDTEGSMAIKENYRPATCIAPGGYDMVIRCWECYEVVSSEHTTLEKIDHVWGEYTHDEGSEKCGVDGTKSAYCLFECGTRDTVTDEGTALTHKMPENATCGDIWNCVHCNEPIALLEHDYAEATCITLATCKRCQATTGDFAPCTPGKPTVEPIVNSTCIERGVGNMLTHCTVCGIEIFRETVLLDLVACAPAAPVQERVIHAVCGEAGSYDEVVYCSVCNDELSRVTKEILALGHDSDTVVPGTAATCTAPGLTDGAKCSKCAKEMTAQTEIPAKGHTIVTDPAVEATCKTDGKTAGEHCSACDYKVEGTVVSKDTVPHTYDDAEDDECNVCGHTRNAS